ncbi:hypothetical protein SAMN03080594_102604 [Arenibacter palladensis]|uniref:Uncharacterized protein n=1 Tax=Arenibacter palladensis TaxID=237373 RepID=A0A1M4YWH2_9FLAO|nr:hypothetical protein SAMN03080594_102604 [Arenibacter palladensis]
MEGLKDLLFFERDGSWAKLLSSSLIFFFLKAFLSKGSDAHEGGSRGPI